MVGDEVRQTRCTTCDAEHPYKGAKVPPKRKKNTTADAYDEVLSSVKKDELVHERATKAQDNGSVTERSAEQPDVNAEDESAPAAEPPNGGSEDGPVRRPLIRATLPRVDNGQPAARPIPQFTIRQAGRSGKFQGRPPGGGRFQKPRGPQDGNRAASGQRGPGHQGRSGHQPPGAFSRSGPPSSRHPQQPGFRPRKKRSR
jgi:hypothetical protein